MRCSYKAVGTVRFRGWLPSFCGLFVQWIGHSATNRVMRVRLLHGLPSFEVIIRIAIERCNTGNASTSFYWSVAQLVQHLAVTQAVRKHITGSNPVAPAKFIASAVSS